MAVCGPQSRWDPCEKEFSVSQVTWLAARGFCSGGGGIGIEGLGPLVIEQTGRQ